MLTDKRRSFQCPCCARIFESQLRCWQHLPTCTHNPTSVVREASPPIFDHEIAKEVDKGFEGAYSGTWEPCRLLRANGVAGTVDVECEADGLVVKGVRHHLVRPLSAAVPPAAVAQAPPPPPPPPLPQKQQKVAVPAPPPLQLLEQQQQQQQQEEEFGSWLATSTDEVGIFISRLQQLLASSEKAVKQAYRVANRPARVAGVCADCGTHTAGGEELFSCSSCSLFWHPGCVPPLYTFPKEGAEWSCLSCPLCQAKARVMLLKERISQLTVLHAIMTREARDAAGSVAAHLLLNVSAAEPNSTTAFLASAVGSKDRTELSDKDVALAVLCAEVSRIEAEESAKITLASEQHTDSPSPKKRKALSGSAMTDGPRKVKQAKLTSADADASRQKTPPNATTEANADCTVWGY